MSHDVHDGVLFGKIIAAAEAVEHNRSGNTLVRLLQKLLDGLCIRQYFRSAFRMRRALLSEICMPFARIQVYPE